MSTIRSGARLWRPVLFVLVGAALGASFLAPVEATTYTRSASCAGVDFYPTDSRTEYDNYTTMRVRRSGDTLNAGTGVFRCDPGLPTGAVVKQVQFTAVLYGGTGVADCALVRSGLAAGAGGGEIYQDLGRVSFGGIINVAVPRLTDSSIANATIDNANWGYWLECSLDVAWGWGVAPGSGLYGADVIYTISAAKG